jgi:hypothetical protein
VTKFLKISQFFLGKKKEFFFKDLIIDKDLIEFAKILTPKSLKKKKW